MAPRGLHVELEFVGSFDIYCKAEHSLCMDYVEVRNTSDFANTGMRLCCHNAPTQRMYSSTNEMLVLFRSYYKPGLGFKASVRAVPVLGRWEQWSEWSSCTASCGGCGTRIRGRNCEDNMVCDGENTVVAPCNTHPCTTCTEERVVSASCGLWGMFRCEKSQTVNVPCQSKCCSGFVLRHGSCEAEA
ncbi:unnamed protein product [Soboliphyme baturini]|uniref:CUB domain-containing protein n=1 Tax=Soboliphyme baturini TaxID=241478 RepID=A0A183IJZ6_9BILA|nr:unnamed protein product [Soboliphyme baturini]